MRGPRFPAFSRISLLPIRKEEEKEELRNSKFPGTALASHLDSHLPKGEKAFPHNEHANVEKKEGERRKMRR